MLAEGKGGTARDRLKEAWTGLKDQGLLSAKELWMTIHYPATARQALGTARCACPPLEETHMRG